MQFLAWLNNAVEASYALIAHGSLWSYDGINGALECGGGLLVWLNVRALWRDQQVKGTQWEVSIFYTLWGIFNLILYPHLNMGISALGAVGLCLGNLTWTLTAASIVVRARRRSHAPNL